MKWNQRLLQTPSEFLPIINTLARRDGAGKGLASNSPLESDPDTALNAQYIKALLAERRVHDYSVVRNTPTVDLAGGGAITFRAPNTLLVGGLASQESCLYSIPVSTLSGWTKLTLPDSIGLTNIGLTDAHTNGTTTIVVGRNGLWRTTNGTTFVKGSTLTAIDNVSQSVTVQPLSITHSGNYWYIVAYGISSLFPYRGVAAIFTSNDDGLTWNNVYTVNDLNNTDLSNARASIYASASNLTVIVKINERLMSSISDLPFISFNRSEPSSPFTSFYGNIHRIGPTTYCTNYEITYDTGVSWVPLIRKNSANITSSATNGNIMLFGTTSNNSVAFSLGDRDIVGVPNQILNPSQIKASRIKYIEDIDSWVTIGDAVGIGGVGGVRLLSADTNNHSLRNYEVFRNFYNFYRN